MDALPTRADPEAGAVPAAVPCQVALRKAWAALALSLAGVLAYALTLRWAWSRESGVLVFVPLGAGAWLAVAALRRDRRPATRVPALAAVGLLAAFAWVFLVVARLPAPSTFEALERLPAVSVLQPGGEPLDLSRVAADGPVLLVLFRGPW